MVAYINKQGETHSAEMCALLCKIMTWCHHYPITLKARYLPGCLNVMADLLSSPTKFSQQNGLCIRRCSNRSVQVVHTSCRSICHSSEAPSGVDSSKNRAFLWGWRRGFAAPQRSSTRTIYKLSGPYLRIGAEKIWWISPVHL